MWVSHFVQIWEPLEAVLGIEGAFQTVCSSGVSPPVRTCPSHSPFVILHVVQVVTLATSKNRLVLYSSASFGSPPPRHPPFYGALHLMTFNINGMFT